MFNREIIREESNLKIFKHGNILNQNGKALLLKLMMLILPVPSTFGTQLSVKVLEEKNCAGKESDLLFTNKTVSESLSSDSYLESHSYNSDNDPEYRPKSLSEDTEYENLKNRI
jgi:hypothetical protein